MESLFLRSKNFFVVIVILFFCSCNKDTSMKNWMQNNGKIKVLSTTSIVGDLVHSIGMEKIDHITLIKGDLDPHSYELVKGDSEKLQFADCIFYNGLGLEQRANLVSYLKKASKAMALGDWIKENHPEKIIWLERQLDPHVWMDVSLWVEVIDPICLSLCEKDPENASFFKNNAELLKSTLVKTHTDIENLLTLIESERKYLVTSHDSFSYFVRAYLSDQQEKEDQSWRKRIAAPEGIVPEGQISCSDIYQILHHIKRFGIKVIFPEYNVNQDAIKKIASAGNEKKMGISIVSDVLYSDSMDYSHDSYEAMMRHNANAIYQYLGQGHE